MRVVYVQDRLILDAWELMREKNIYLYVNLIYVENLCI